MRLSRVLFMSSPGAFTTAGKGSSVLSSIATANTSSSSSSTVSITSSHPSDAATGAAAPLSLPSSLEHHNSHHNQQQQHYHPVASGGASLLEHASQLSDEAVSPLPRNPAVTAVPAAAVETLDGSPIGSRSSSRIARLLPPPLLPAELLTGIAPPAAARAAPSDESAPSTGTPPLHDADDDDTGDDSSPAAAARPTTPSTDRATDRGRRTPSPAPPTDGGDLSPDELHLSGTALPAAAAVVVVSVVAGTAPPAPALSLPAGVSPLLPRGGPLLSPSTVGDSGGGSNSDIRSERASMGGGGPRRRPRGSAAAAAPPPLRRDGPPPLRPDSASTTGTSRPSAARRLSPLRLQAAYDKDDDDEDTATLAPHDDTGAEGGSLDDDIDGDDEDGVVAVGRRPSRPRHPRRGGSSSRTRSHGNSRSRSSPSWRHDRRAAGGESPEKSKRGRSNSSSRSPGRHGSGGSRSRSQSLSASRAERRHQGKDGADGGGRVSPTRVESPHRGRSSPSHSHSQRLSVPRRRCGSRGRNKRHDDDDGATSERRDTNTNTNTSTVTGRSLTSPGDRQATLVPAGSASVATASPMPSPRPPPPQPSSQQQQTPPPRPSLFSATEEVPSSSTSPCRKRKEGGRAAAAAAPSPPRPPSLPPPSASSLRAAPAPPAPLLSSTLDSRNSIPRRHRHRSSSSDSSDRDNSRGDGGLVRLTATDAPPPPVSPFDAATAGEEEQRRRHHHRRHDGSGSAVGPRVARADDDTHSGGSAEVAAMLGPSVWQAQTAAAGQSGGGGRIFSDTESESEASPTEDQGEVAAGEVDGDNGRSKSLPTPIADMANISGDLHHSSSGDDDDAEESQERTPPLPAAGAPALDADTATPIDGSGSPPAPSDEQPFTGYSPPPMLTLFSQTPQAAPPPQPSPSHQSPVSSATASSTFATPVERSPAPPPAAAAAAEEDTLKVRMIDSMPSVDLAMLAALRAAAATTGTDSASSQRSTPVIQDSSAFGGTGSGFEGTVSGFGGAASGAFFPALQQAMFQAQASVVIPRPAAAGAGGGGGAAGHGRDDNNHGGGSSGTGSYYYTSGYESDEVSYYYTYSTYTDDDDASSSAAAAGTTSSLSSDASTVSTVTSSFASREEGTATAAAAVADPAGTPSKARAKKDDYAERVSRTKEARHKSSAVPKLSASSLSRPKPTPPLTPKSSGKSASKGRNKSMSASASVSGSKLVYRREDVPPSEPSAVFSAIEELYDPDQKQRQLLQERERGREQLDGTVGGHGSPDHERRTTAIPLFGDDDDLDESADRSGHGSNAASGEHDRVPTVNDDATTAAAAAAGVSALDGTEDPFSINISSIHAAAAAAAGGDDDGGGDGDDEGLAKAPSAAETVASGDAPESKEGTEKEPRSAPLSVSFALESSSGSASSLPLPADSVQGDGEDGGGGDDGHLGGNSGGEVASRPAAPTDTSANAPAASDNSTNAKVIIITDGGFLSSAAQSESESEKGDNEIKEAMGVEEDKEEGQEPPLPSLYAWEYREAMPIFRAWEAEPPRSVFLGPHNEQLDPYYGRDRQGQQQRQHQQEKTPLPLPLPPPPVPRLFCFIELNALQRLSLLLCRQSLDPAMAATLPQQQVEYGCLSLRVSLYTCCDASNNRSSSMITGGDGNGTAVATGLAFSLPCTVESLSRRGAADSWCDVLFLPGRRALEALAAVAPFVTARLECARLAEVGAVSDQQKEESDNGGGVGGGVGCIDKTDNVAGHDSRNSRSGDEQGTVAAVAVQLPAVPSESVSSTDTTPSLPSGLPPPSPSSSPSSSSSSLSFSTESSPSLLSEPPVAAPAMEPAPLPLLPLPPPPQGPRRLVTVWEPIAESDPLPISRLLATATAAATADSSDGGVAAGTLSVDLRVTTAGCRLTAMPAGAMLGLARGGGGGASPSWFYHSQQQQRQEHTSAEEAVLSVLWAAAAVAVSAGDALVPCVLCTTESVPCLGSPPAGPEQYSDSIYRLAPSHSSATTMMTTTMKSAAVSLAIRRHVECRYRRCQQQQQRWPAAPSLLDDTSATAGGCCGAAASGLSALLPLLSERGPNALSTPASAYDCCSGSGDTYAAAAGAAVVVVAGNDAPRPKLSVMWNTLPRRPAATDDTTAAGGAGGKRGVNPTTGGGGCGGRRRRHRGPPPVGCSVLLHVTVAVLERLPLLERSFPDPKHNTSNSNVNNSHCGGSAAGADAVPRSWAPLPHVALTVSGGSEGGRLGRTTVPASALWADTNDNGDGVDDGTGQGQRTAPPPVSTQAPVVRLDYSLHSHLSSGGGGGGASQLLLSLHSATTEEALLGQASLDPFAAAQLTTGGSGGGARLTQPFGFSDAAWLPLFARGPATQHSSSSSSSGEGDCGASSSAAADRKKEQSSRKVHGASAATPADGMAHVGWLHCRYECLFVPEDPRAVPTTARLSEALIAHNVRRIQRRRRQLRLRDSDGAHHSYSNNIDDDNDDSEPPALEPLMMLDVTVVAASGLRLPTPAATVGAASVILCSAFCEVGALLHSQRGPTAKTPLGPGRGNRTTTPPPATTTGGGVSVHRSPVTVSFAVERAGEEGEEDVSLALHDSLTSSSGLLLLAGGDASSSSPPPPADGHHHCITGTVRGSDYPEWRHCFRLDAAAVSRLVLRVFSRTSGSGSGGQLTAVLLGTATLPSAALVRMWLGGREEGSAWLPLHATPPAPAARGSGSVGVQSVLVRWSRPDFIAAPYGAAMPSRRLAEAFPCATHTIASPELRVSADGNRDHDDDDDDDDTDDGGDVVDLDRTIAAAAMTVTAANEPRQLWLEVGTIAVVWPWLLQQQQVIECGTDTGEHGSGLVLSLAAESFGVSSPVGSWRLRPRAATPTTAAASVAGIAASGFVLEPVAAAAATAASPVVVCFPVSAAVVVGGDSGRHSLPPPPSLSWAIEWRAKRSGGSGSDDRDGSPAAMVVARGRWQPQEQQQQQHQTASRSSSPLLFSREASLVAMEALRVPWAAAHNQQPQPDECGSSRAAAALNRIETGFLTFQHSCYPSPATAAGESHIQEGGSSNGVGVGDDGRRWEWPAAGTEAHLAIRVDEWVFFSTTTTTGGGGVGDILGVSLVEKDPLGELAATTIATTTSTATVAPLVPHGFTRQVKFSEDTAGCGRSSGGAAGPFAGACSIASSGFGGGGGGGSAAGSSSVRSAASGHPVTAASASSFVPVTMHATWPARRFAWFHRPAPDLTLLLHRGGGGPAAGPVALVGHVRLPALAPLARSRGSVWLPILSPASCLDNVSDIDPAATSIDVVGYVRIRYRHNLVPAASAAEEEGRESDVAVAGRVTATGATAASQPPPPPPPPAALLLVEVVSLCRRTGQSGHHHNDGGGGGAAVLVGYGDRTAALRVAPGVPSQPVRDVVAFPYTPSSSSTQSSVRLQVIGAAGPGLPTTTTASSSAVLQLDRGCDDGSPPAQPHQSWLPLMAPATKSSSSSSGTTTTLSGEVCVRWAVWRLAAGSAVPEFNAAFLAWHGGRMRVAVAEDDNADGEGGVAGSAISVNRNNGNDRSALDHLWWRDDGGSAAAVPAPSPPTYLALSDMAWEMPSGGGATAATAEALVARGLKQVWVEVSGGVQPGAAAAAVVGRTMPVPCAFTSNVSDGSGGTPTPSLMLTGSGNRDSNDDSDTIVLPLLPTARPETDEAGDITVHFSVLASTDSSGDVTTAVCIATGVARLPFTPGRCPACSSCWLPPQPCAVRLTATASVGGGGGLGRLTWWMEEVAHPFNNSSPTTTPTTAGKAAEARAATTTAATPLLLHLSITGLRLRGIDLCSPACAAAMVPLLSSSSSSCRPEVVVEAVAPVVARAADATDPDGRCACGRLDRAVVATPLCPRALPPRRPLAWAGDVCVCDSSTIALYCTIPGRFLEAVAAVADAAVVGIDGSTTTTAAAAAVFTSVAYARKLMPLPVPGGSGGSGSGALPTIHGKATLVIDAARLRSGAGGSAAMVEAVLTVTDAQSESWLGEARVAVSLLAVLATTRKQRRAQWAAAAVTTLPTLPSPPSLPSSALFFSRSVRVSILRCVGPVSGGDVAQLQCAMAACLAGVAAAAAAEARGEVLPREQRRALAAAAAVLERFLRSNVHPSLSLSSSTGALQLAMTGLNGGGGGQPDAVVVSRSFHAAPVTAVLAAAAAATNSNTTTSSGAGRFGVCTAADKPPLLEASAIIPERNGPHSVTASLELRAVAAAAKGILMPIATGDWHWSPVPSSTDDYDGGGGGALPRMTSALAWVPLLPLGTNTVDVPVASALVRSVATTAVAVGSHTLACLHLAAVPAAALVPLPRLAFPCLRLWYAFTDGTSHEQYMPLHAPSCGGGSGDGAVVSSGSSSFWPLSSSSSSAAAVTVPRVGLFGCRLTRLELVDFTSTPLPAAVVEAAAVTVTMKKSPHHEQCQRQQRQQPVAAAVVLASHAWQAADEEALFPSPPPLSSSSGGKGSCQGGITTATAASTQWRRLGLLPRMHRVTLTGRGGCAYRLLLRSSPKCCDEEGEGGNSDESSGAAEHSRASLLPLTITGFRLRVSHDDDRSGGGGAAAAAAGAVTAPVVTCTVLACSAREGAAFPPPPPATIPWAVAASAVPATSCLVQRGAQQGMEEEPGNRDGNDDSGSSSKAKDELHEEEKAPVPVSAAPSCLEAVWALAPGGTDGITIPFNRRGPPSEASPEERWRSLQSFVMLSLVSRAGNSTAPPVTHTAVFSLDDLIRHQQTDKSNSSGLGFIASRVPLVSSSSGELIVEWLLPPACDGTTTTATTGGVSRPRIAIPVFTDTEEQQRRQQSRKRRRTIAGRPEADVVASLYGDTCGDCDGEERAGAVAVAAALSAAARALLVQSALASLVRDARPRGRAPRRAALQHWAWTVRAVEVEGLRPARLEPPGPLDALAMRGDGVPLLAEMAFAATATANTIRKKGGKGDCSSFAAVDSPEGSVVIGVARAGARLDGAAATTATTATIAALLPPPPSGSRLLPDCSASFTPIAWPVLFRDLCRRRTRNGATLSLWQLLSYPTSVSASNNDDDDDYVGAVEALGAASLRSVLKDMHTLSEAALTQIGRVIAIEEEAEGTEEGGGVDSKCMAGQRVRGLLSSLSEFRSEWLPLSGGTAQQQQQGRLRLVLRAPWADASAMRAVADAATALLAQQKSQQQKERLLSSPLADEKRRGPLPTRAVMTAYITSVELRGGGGGGQTALPPLALFAAATSAGTDSSGLLFHQTRLTPVTSVVAPAAAGDDEVAPAPRAAAAVVAVAVAAAAETVPVPIPIPLPVLVPVPIPVPVPVTGEQQDTSEDTSSDEETAAPSPPPPPPPQATDAATVTLSAARPFFTWEQLQPQPPGGSAAAVPVSLRVYVAACLPQPPGSDASTILFAAVAPSDIEGIVGYADGCCTVGLNRSSVAGRGTAVDVGLLVPVSLPSPGGGGVGVGGASAVLAVTLHVCCQSGEGSAAATAAAAARAALERRSRTASGSTPTTEAEVSPIAAALRWARALTMPWLPPCPLELSVASVRHAAPASGDREEPEENCGDRGPAAVVVGGARAALATTSSSRTLVDGGIAVALPTRTPTLVPSPLVPAPPPHHHTGGGGTGTLLRTKGHNSAVVADTRHRRRHRRHSGISSRSAPELALTQLVPTRPSLGSSSSSLGLGRSLRCAAGPRVSTDNSATGEQATAAATAAGGVVMIATPAMHLGSGGGGADASTADACGCYVGHAAAAMGGSRGNYDNGNHNGRSAVWLLGGWRAVDGGWSRVVRCVRLDPTDGGRPMPALTLPSGGSTVGGNNHSNSHHSTPRVACSAAMPHAASIFLFGGLVPSPSGDDAGDDGGAAVVSNDVLVYDTVGLEWSRLPAPSQPPLTATATDSNSDSDGDDDCCAMSPSGVPVTAAALWPAPRYGHSVVRLPSAAGNDTTASSSSNISNSTLSSFYVVCGGAVSPDRLVPASDMLWVCELTGGGGGRPISCRWHRVPLPSPRGAAGSAVRLRPSYAPRLSFARWARPVDGEGEGLWAHSSLRVTGGIDQPAATVTAATGGGVMIGPAATAALPWLLGTSFPLSAPGRAVTVLDCVCPCRVPF